MSNLTTPAPAVQLVDLAGRPIRPEKRTPAHSWPAWTDLVRVRLGASDDDLDRLRLSAGLGDTLTAVIWRAEQPVPDPYPCPTGEYPTVQMVPPAADADDGLAAFEAIRGGAPAPDRSLDLPTLERVAAGLYGDAPTAAR